MADKNNKYSDIFFTALRLGFTSFGGPIAHLGYFREEYVHKRKWLDDKTYADLVALCQFLPGPASSQVGIGVGTLRGGVVGGLLAWLGFTMPSVIALILFAYFLQQSSFDLTGLIHALKIVAVAVVAQALVGMGRNLANTKGKAALAVFSALFVLWFPSAIVQILIIVAAAFIGYFIYRKENEENRTKTRHPLNKRGWMWLLLFAVLLALLPLLRSQLDSIYIAIADTFYRVGSIVFGGGHVVLPMLEREVVPPGWITKSDFLAGYGAAQAVPGPLFTFSAYLGMMTAGLKGAIIVVVAIFLPSFFFVFGVLPYWNGLRNNSKFSAALVGVNAAVVGLLLAAFYDPLFTSAVKTSMDFAFASIAFTALVIWKVPPWIIVLVAVCTGILTTL